MEGHVDSPVAPESNDVESVVRYAVGGMTCVACSRAITEAVADMEGLVHFVVNQVDNSAAATISRAELAQEIATRIEDIGYECSIVSVTPVRRINLGEEFRRSVGLEFKGTDSV